MKLKQEQRKNKTIEDKNQENFNRRVKRASKPSFEKQLENEKEKEIKRLHRANRTSSEKMLENKKK